MCSSRYLLAHETKKIEFSVVLNFEKKHRQDFPITIFAYGLHIDLGYDRATVYDAKVALPQRLAAGRVFISRGVESVCVEVKKDLRVCCYDDSKSCTVATTRWYVGRLNGLLGKADNDAGHIKQQDWYCTFFMCFLLLIIYSFIGKFFGISASPHFLSRIVT